MTLSFDVSRVIDSNVEANIKADPKPPNSRNDHLTMKIYHWSKSDNYNHLYFSYLCYFRIFIPPDYQVVSNYAAENALNTGYQFFNDWYSNIFDKA